LVFNIFPYSSVFFFRYLFPNIQTGNAVSVPSQGPSFNSGNDGPPRPLLPFSQSWENALLFSVNSHLGIRTLSRPHLFFWGVQGKNRAESCFPPHVPLPFVHRRINLPLSWWLHRYCVILPYSSMRGLFFLHDLFDLCRLLFWVPAPSWFSYHALVTRAGLWANTRVFETMNNLSSPMDPLVTAPLFPYS